MSALKEVREALSRAERRARKALWRANYLARPLPLSHPLAQDAMRKHSAWRALNRFSATLRRIEKKHSKRPKGET